MGTGDMSVNMVRNRNIWLLLVVSYQQYLSFFSSGRSGMGVDEVEKCRRFDEMRFVEIDEA